MLDSIYHMTNTLKSHFWHPKHMFKLMGKKIITILGSNTVIVFLKEFFLKSKF